MKYGLNVKPSGSLEFLSLGALVNRLDPGIIPFRKAAHLIHGSAEGRFSITCCPGHLTHYEIGGVGFKYADLKTLTRHYDPARLKDGRDTLLDGEKIFYISNPALGLWACRSRFMD
jgi:hypothetical protein